MTLRDLCKTSPFPQSLRQTQISHEVKPCAILKILRVFLRLHEVKRQRYIFVLTRGIHAPRPCGQSDDCPIPLSCGIVLDLGQN
jgi:hypothetical protein